MSVNSRQFKFKTNFKSNDEKAQNLMNLAQTNNLNPKFLGRTYSFKSSPATADKTKVLHEELYDSNFINQPNLNWRSIITDSVTKQVWLDVQVTTDEFGRRLTIPLNKKSNQGIAMFGCSFTFGEGVGNENTMASKLSKKLKKWQIYNYGTPGAGPLEALFYIKHERFKESFDYEKSYAIYTFISDHARRTQLSMANIKRYLKYSDFSSNESDYYLSISNPKNSIFWKIQFYKLLLKSETLKYFGINIPNDVSEDSVELAAQYLLEIKMEWQRKFKNENFIVLLWPNYDNAEILKKRLDELKIYYLDYSRINLAEYVEEVTVNEYEIHPSHEVYDFFSDRLIQELKLN